MRKKVKYLSERQMQADKMLRDGDFRSIREILDRLIVFYPSSHILAGLDDNKKLFFYNSIQLREEVMNLGDGLINAGFKDKHIAVIADNSSRYVIADMCISSGVGVVIPLDVEAPAEFLSRLLEKCDADVILCSARCLDKMDEIRKINPRFGTVITIDRKVENIPYYEEFVEAGEAMREKSVYRNIDLDPDAPAKILFTSGTTGANKGVVLTNANLAANAVNCMDAIRAGEGNTSMSILPMHHATEINTHITTRIACGKLTYINDSVRNMMTNIKIFKPDIITIVPMIANSFYKSIWAAAQKNGRADKLRKGIKLSRLLRKFGIDRTHEMFAEIYAPFGGRLNMIVCGGAMLNPTVVKGMNDLGIRMENGYGITECGPLISMNSDTLEEYRSVGRPCPGLEARIADPDENGVGELCIRGRSVSSGYYKDPEATAQVFGPDGFFNTGDSARIDENGRIFLMGRKKNTIILDSGRNICPEEVENMLETAMPYADDIVVYQAEYKKENSSRKLLCAGIFIEDENKRKDLSSIQADISSVNLLLPEYKRIEYLELPSKEYDKTSTRKIRRVSLPSECSSKGIMIL